VLEAGGAEGVIDANGGRIHVSERTRELLESRYAFEPRGLIGLRGIGKVRTSF
jgi:class 3 adenylate cyclase